MGSVETLGPDEVGRHKHPMLDQMFLGLPGCDGEVWADGETTGLRGLDLIHIPLGSTHGASVGEGKKLSYIWIDRYIDRELCQKWFARDHEEGDGMEDEAEEKVRLGAQRGHWAVSYTHLTLPTKRIV